MQWFNLVLAFAFVVANLALVLAVPAVESEDFGLIRREDHYQCTAKDHSVCGEGFCAVPKQDNPNLGGVCKNPFDCCTLFQTYRNARVGGLWCYGDPKKFPGAFGAVGQDDCSAITGHA